MELLYEEVLDHLIMHQDELSNADRVRLVQSLSNYLLPKTKSVRDQFTLEQLKERDQESLLHRGPLQSRSCSNKRIGIGILICLCSYVAQESRLLRMT